MYLDAEAISKLVNLKKLAAGGWYIERGVPLWKKKL
jgi:hypothetical protein